MLFLFSSTYQILLGDAFCADSMRWGYSAAELPRTTRREMLVSFISVMDMVVGWEYGEVIGAML